MHKTLIGVALAGLLALGGTACSDDGSDDPCEDVSCGDHGSCNPETGSCDCETGYTGAACDACQDGFVEESGECVAGECIETAECGENAHCDETTWSCLCDEGYAPVQGECVAEVLSDFDDLDLDAESYWSGEAAGVSTFTSGDASFLNFYDTEYDYWEGFAYSSTTDTTTGDYTNQYSAITGGGHAGSTTYGVGYVGFMGYDPELRLLGDDAPHSVAGLYVTNTTYAYLTMRDGGDFSKQFGGVDGTDPDWFKLTIVGLSTGDATTGAVDFYLADYRDPDDATDYILDEWTWVDLSSLGPVIGLRFSLSSSDTGAYGMNNPAYFAVDTVRRVAP